MRKQEGIVKRQVSLWLAIMAVLMAALAPAVSQAVRAADPLAWAEVCSASAKSAAAGQQAPADGAAHLFEHCPYCSLHSAGLGMPPAALSLALLPALSAELPALFLGGPRGLHSWTAAQPRGPPAASLS